MDEDEKISLDAKEAYEAIAPVYDDFTAGHDFDLTASPKCAYIAWLRVTLRLTVGYGPIPPDYYDHVAFCKV